MNIYILFWDKSFYWFIPYAHVFKYEHARQNTWDKLVSCKSFVTKIKQVNDN
jgi:hypothetical protein